MPKILGRDASLLKQCTCKNCATIAEYAPNELFSDYRGSHERDKYGNWRWGHVYHSWVVCPQCRNKISIEVGHHVPEYGF